MAFEEYASQGKVSAEQIEEARSVITPQGSVSGLPGQWEVRYPDGNVRVLDDEAFQTEWGGKSGDSEESSQLPLTEPPAEKSLLTQESASAESNNGDDEPTTVDAGSGSESSRGSSRRTRKGKEQEEDEEPPV